MSNKEYFNICESDGWEEELKNDPDYRCISIDYSNESWEQFEKDLFDTDSLLNKALKGYTKRP